MSPTQELHVVFGTGAVGRAVMNELIARGRRVRMVNTSGKLAEAPQGVQAVGANLYDANCVRDLTRDAAVVYHCAQPGYTEWPQKFPSLQAAIVEGVAQTGAKLVVCENLYMYGDQNGKPLTEDSPLNGHGRKPKVRDELTRALFEAHRAGKVKVTAARGSNFFGPFALSSSVGERAFYPALAGKPAELYGNIDLPHTPTYVSDFGKAMVILGEHDEAFGHAWHVPNDQPMITQRQFITQVFEELGTPVKFSVMGKLMLTIGGLFVPEAKEMIEMQYEFTKPFIVNSEKFERAFGVKATPLRQAIRETIQWYRSHPPTKH